jgi:nucleoid DNA-binding protein
MRGALFISNPVKMEKHLIEIAAKSLKEDPKMVADIVNFYEKFIADTIRSGKFENVRVPHFGIFRVSIPKLKHYIKIQSEPEVITAKNPT